MQDNKLALSTEPTMAKAPNNECDVKSEQFAFSFTDRAASAFAWAVSLAVLFASAAAVLIAFFTRDRERPRE